MLILCQTKLIVLSSPKWILNLLFTIQLQSTLKCLFSAISVSVILLCWNIKQLSSAYSNSQESTAFDISFIYNRKRSGPEMDPWGTPHRRFPGSEKIFLIKTLSVLRFKPSSCFFSESYELHFLLSKYRGLQYQKLSVHQLKSCWYKDQIFKFI